MRFQLKYVGYLPRPPPADHHQSSPEHRQRRPRRSSKATGQDPTNSDGALNSGPKTNSDSSNSNNDNGHDTKTNSYIPGKSGETTGSTISSWGNRLWCFEWKLSNDAIRAPADKKTFRQNLRKFAEGIYKRLKDEPRGEVIYVKGYNLVAALFVPDNGIFLSTIPRRSGAEAMAADWKTKAPRLAYATGGRRNGEEDHPNRFHAEDGAIYTYETEAENGKGLDDVGLKFPSGTEILVYGKRNSYDTEPGVMPPCSPSNPTPGETVRNPSCVEVLYELNIKGITKDEAR
ncbi:hypothetical protein BDV09DRAFT_200793 [Aspergillus tetrazonus]